MGHFLKRYGALLWVTLFFGSMPGMTVEEVRIAAVVGDKIISITDLDHRVRLALLSAGITPSTGAFSKLRPQVLETMVNEIIQIAKAKEFDITASPGDIDAATQQIEHRNNMQAGAMKKMLADNKIPYDLFAQNVTASIVWWDYIRAKYQTSQGASRHEIDQAQKKNAFSKALGHTLLGELYISFDGVGDEEKAKIRATQFVQELEKGASFSALAAQFSDSASAARGGDIGWVPDGHLPFAELNHAVSALKPGQITAPIRTQNGYYVLMIREKKAPGQAALADTLMNFHQVLRPLTAPFQERDIAAATAQMNRLKAGASSCGLLETLSKSDASLELRTVQKASLGQMVPQLQELLGPLSAGDSTPPILSDKGILLFMVCSKETIDPDDLSEDDIRSIILDQKLNLMSMREMGNLRRTTYINVRLPAATS